MNLGKLLTMDTGTVITLTLSLSSLRKPLREPAICPTSLQLARSRAFSKSIHRSFPTICNAPSIYITYITYISINIPFASSRAMLIHLLRRLHSQNPSPSIFQSIHRSAPKTRHLRMASTFPDLPIFRAIASHDPKSTAIIHSRSERKFTYGELLKDVEGAKITLYNQLKSASAEGESRGGQRVAFLVENGYDYVGASSSCFSALLSS